MKKILFLIATIVMAFTVKAADVDAHVATVNKLAEELAKKLEKAPKEAGVPDLDNFVKENKECAEASLASAALMTDLLANKADVAQWLNLAATVKAQGEKAAKIGQDADKAAKAVKDMPKMKAVGAAKNLKWATDLLPLTLQIITEEGLVAAEMTK